MIFPPACASHSTNSPTDHLGSVREVLLLDGPTNNPTTATLTARYDYDLWGKRTVLDGGTPAETLTLTGYTGHELHRWSGLYLAPYRAYSFELGRWISRDPIGEAGGINLFAYVGNAPEVMVDPLGLDAKAVAQGVGSFFRANGRSFRHAARTLGLLGNDEEVQAATENVAINAARQKYFSDPCFQSAVNRALEKKIENKLMREAPNLVGRSGFVRSEGVS